MLRYCLFSRSVSLAGMGGQALLRLNGHGPAYAGLPVRSALSGRPQNSRHRTAPGCSKTRRSNSCGLASPIAPIGRRAQCAYTALARPCLRDARGGRWCF